MSKEFFVCFFAERTDWFIDLPPVRQFLFTRSISASVCRDISHLLLVDNDWLLVDVNIDVYHIIIIIIIQHVLNLIGSFKYRCVFSLPPHGWTLSNVNRVSVDKNNARATATASVTVQSLFTLRQISQCRRSIFSFCYFFPVVVVVVVWPIAVLTASPQLLLWHLPQVLDVQPC